jgi:N-acetylneuraminic acid mutarotase
MQNGTHHLTLKAPVLAVLALLAAGCQSSLPSEPESAAPGRPNSVALTEGSPNTWQARPPMPTARYGLVAATVNGIVYAIGGRDGTGTRRTVEAYDPGTNTFLVWQPKAPLPAGRLFPSAGAVINGKIYVAGGRNGSDTPTKSLFVYNPATDQWSKKAAMPVASSHGAAGAINGKLYVYTPANPNTGTGPFLHRYDPATNAWVQRAVPPHGNAFAAAGVIGGKFYLAGGFAGLYSATLDVYNPGTNSWTTKKSMPAARGYAAGAVLQGMLYVVGGSTSEGAFGRVERYDPVSNTWTAAATMLTHRFHLGAAAANGVLYALGGAGAPNSLDSNEAYTP